MLSILRAIRIVGSQAKLAKAVGVSRAAVHQWTIKMRPIPAARCKAIERATGGKITCEKLRPDLNWDYVKKQRKKKEEPHEPR